MSNHEDYLRREAIKQRYAELGSKIAVAREFGVTRERIRQVVGTARPKLQINWDQDCISFARMRWDEGAFASEIAEEMGVTRNSIVGIAHRNNFPPRPSPIRRRAA